MLTWKEIVQNYITRHSDQISKTTQPLKDHFGIGYFTYHRIDNDGKYTVLVDRPDWAEYYVSEQIFLNDPYLRHPSVYQSGLTLVNNQGDEEYREMILKAGSKVLDMDIGTVLIQKNRHSVEFFGFSANKKTSALENIYLNRPQLLASFATYFKQQLGNVLTKMEESASSLIDLKGEDFICNKPVCPDISPNSVLSFYKDIGVKDALEKAEKLSPQERKCLKLLIEGQSAKETAIALGLSRRTIESYLENIKNKLSCWSKQDILQEAKILDDFGLI